MADPGNYKHLSANGTTTICTGSGKLCGVTVNTKGASANTCTLYDNTAGSGTVIAVIDTTSPASANLEYNTLFGVGLTAVLATGTSADLTITFA